MSRLISAKEAARLIGIPYSSLRDAAQRGKIPVVRVNRAWYFARVDLDKFIEQHTGIAV